MLTMLCSQKLLMVIRTVLLVLLASLAFTRADAQNGGTKIDFTVSMPQPHTHLFEVDMRITEHGATYVRENVLIMPVWTPGSYMIREFSRHVQDFSAEDGSGRSLPWEKINKNSWKVRTDNARDVRVRYRVYANELTVRTSELNSDHAFWNNANLLMYLERSLNQATTLRINPPAGWKIATGLPAVPGVKNTFSAESFDILYDSPVEVSDFREMKFEVRGVPHRIVIDGEGNYNPERLLNSVRRIVEAQIAMFGEIPYRDYTFILHLRANTGGALEHLNSTALGFRRNSFSTERGYFNFAAVVSHEFFHLWNVKRIRPEPLGPFNYNVENYTRLLWVAEGITEYYGNLMVRRAGLISEDAYVALLATNIRSFQEQPGRRVMSVEESSFDSWIKYYRPDENAVNSSISYYEKGELLGLLLDLEIRRRTNGAKSLDDVMRYLNSEFAKKNRNYADADFQKTCEAIAGRSFEEFFARYVRGKDELPYNQVFSAVGLRLEQAGVAIGTPANEIPANVPTAALLGADLEETGGRLTIKAVRAGTPAYEQGLNANDEIVAFNGQRVNKESFEERLAERRPGDTITLVVFRFDDLRTFQIKLGARIDAPYRFAWLPQVSEQQRKLLRDWLALTR